MFKIRKDIRDIKIGSTIYKVDINRSLKNDEPLFQEYRILEIEYAPPVAFFEALRLHDNKIRSLDLWLDRPETYWFTDKKKAIRYLKRESKQVLASLENNINKIKETLNYFKTTN